MTMRKMLVALSFLATAAFPEIGLTANAAALKVAKPMPARTTAPSKKTVRTAAKTGAVSQIRDLVYASLSGSRPLTLDLYAPPRAPKDFPKPLLVFVHGGGWNSGDARQGGGYNDFPGVLADFAAKGYVVVSVNYRFSSEARYPAAVQDVKAAIRWLRAHAADYDIDTTRVAIWGEEAGGQIAALMGTSCGVAVLEPNDGVTNNTPSDCVQAVIDWHGIVDLGSLGGQPPTPAGLYLGCEPAQCEAGVLHVANPIAYIGPNTPPFLIQHGVHNAVPLAQSQKLYDALRAAHVPVDYVTYADSEKDVAKRGLDKVADFLGQNFPRKPMNKKPPRVTSKALPY
jgi:acetyl esterase/lipase